jgi:WD40 repeat protein
MIAHRSPISGIATHGRRYVATAGYDSQVILWDAATRSAISRARHDHLANHCAFSPDGKLLLTGSSDYSARLWSVPDLTLLAVLRHDDDVERVAWSPDGKHVATASRDRTARIWTRDGQLVHHLKGHAVDCAFVEFSRDGRELVSNSDDGDIRRWSVETGELLERVAFGGSQMDTIALGDDGVLYAGTDDGEIAASVNGAIVVNAGHALGVKCLVFDRASGRLVSTGYDGYLRVWRPEPGGKLAMEVETRAPMCVWLRCCAIDARNRVVVGTFGTSYAVFDVGAKRWDLEGVEATPGLNAVTFAEGSVWSVGDAGIVWRDGEPIAKMPSLCNFLLAWNGRVLTGGQSGAVFDARTGRTLFEQPSPINCGAVIRRGDEELAVFGTYSGEAFVLRAHGERLDLVKRIEVFPAAIKGLAVHGTTLFASSADFSVAFVSVVDLMVARHVPDAHGAIVNGCATIPGGRFATVSRDRVLRLWAAERSDAFPTPHAHSVRCIAACRATGLVATGAYDGTVALFDTDTKKWLKIERLTDFGISSLARGDRPGAFLASSYDGHVYEVTANARPRRLRANESAALAHAA